MKTVSPMAIRPFFCVLAGACVIFVSSNANAAVGVTISPALITHDFVGKITLTITGLTAGASVRVEQIWDLNTNGLVETNEPVVRSFVVSDGQMPVLCSLTNLNVPGDVDGSANGRIKTELFWPGVDNVLATASGKFIYRVSNPTNGAQLATQSFTNVQKIHPQGARGRITAGGAPVSNSITGLSRPNSPDTCLAATDTNGNYSFYALPGNYTVFAVLKSGFVSDATTGAVTVVANQFVTNNFALTGAGFTLSGQVSDSSTGKGIPGITVSASSTNNLFSIGITDTNGNYNLPVTSSQWKVKPEAAQLAALGYLSLAKNTKVTVTISSISGVNFQLPKADALIYGTVKDTAGNPILGLECDAQNGSQYETRGRSYAPDGTYMLGVQTGTNWNVIIQNDTLWINGFAGPQPNVGVDLTAVCSARVDLVVTRMNLSGPARLSSNQFQFTLNGVNQQNYTLQASSNLLDWSSLLVTSAPSDSFMVVDPAATNGQGFYRALVGP